MYRKVLDEIPNHIDEAEDSIRVYRMIGSGEVSLFGKNVEPKVEDIIII